MANKIEIPTTDQGEVNFGVNLGTGMVAVQLRAPLSITKQTVQVRIIDFLEIAADVLAQMCAMQKAQAAHFASARKDAPKEA